ncbi:MAG TPA: glycosyltransferase 87 family protein [Solirubrobacteraceae bacterium]|jgi:hypothetical protein|nr:glycosyltransferase 87 family protein [Solirubrobacteraceae bacterium]
MGVVLRRACVAALVFGGSAYVALTAHVLPKLGDYPADAGPPIRALTELHIGRFLALQPMMGAASLLIRAPFAALAYAFGGGEHLAYRLGALPCILAAAVVVAALVGRMNARQRSLGARVMVLALVVFNPSSGVALSFGHPEELFVAALAVATVMVAARPGRSLLAGVMLGITLATKQWAVIVFLPVLLAAPAHRVRLGATALAVAAAFTVPQFLADPSSYAAHTKSLASVNNWVSPTNIWWLFAQVRWHQFALYSLPDWVNPLPHPLIVLVGVGLGLTALVRRRQADAHGAMELLALVLLTRCVLDSWTNEYYYVPFLLALIARDALASRGLPLLAAFATVMLIANFGYVPLYGGNDLINAFNLTWTLALVVWLGFCVLAPELTQTVRRVTVGRLLRSQRGARLASARDGLG